MSYILLTTPLILHADPILPSHAVTRQYVDAKRLNVNASWFTTGTISAARMPSLGGDISSVAGSGTVSLNVNGAIAGTYTKVTVDATGRVTAGGTLVAADIASVSWTKITSGKPTTAAGYGITNLISLSGGTASGNISSTATPSAALHAVTKGYVDNAISGVVSASLSVGDVLRKPLTIAPSGFLRCNGGVVNRTTYTGLFAIVGTVYNKAGSLNSGGKPWRLQYDFNKTQTSGITGWTTTTSLPIILQAAQAIVTSNRVYLIGGIANNSLESSAIYTAPINSDGTLGTWATSAPLPTAVSQSQVVVISNRVYLIGGSDTSIVYTATINSDGTLNSWTTSNPLPFTSRYSQVIVTSSRVYILAGNVNNAPSSVVYSSVINTDGTLGTWTIGTAIPTTIYQAQAIVTSSRVYLIGGITASYGNAVSAFVYTAPINADGTLGTWTTSSDLPGPISNSQSVVTSSRVFLLGGQTSNAGTNTASVYTAPINADGTLGTWTTSTSLSFTAYEFQVIVSSSRVYILGGYLNGASSAVVYMAPFLGGYNDYTNYSTQITTASTDFTLPDFSSLEKNSLNYFIKT